MTITWTLPGIVEWIWVRLNLIIFYSVFLGVPLLLSYRKKFSLPKATIYTVTFLGLVVGVWEYPLFLSGVQAPMVGGMLNCLPWMLVLLGWMAPFFLVCLLFRVRFHFSRDDGWRLFWWIMFSWIFAEIEAINLATGTIYLWNYYISFVPRTFTAVFLHLTLRPETTSKKSAEEKACGSGTF